MERLLRGLYRGNLSAFMNSWEPVFEKGKKCGKYDVKEQLSCALSGHEGVRNLKRNSRCHLDHQSKSRWRE